MKTQLIGIDEVGRGCWAGPLIAAAVCLKHEIAELDDSKKLSKVNSERLANIIYQYGSVGIGSVTPQEVDDIGLTAAVRLAMQRAYDNLNIAGATIIIDGNYNYLAHIQSSTAIIKADGCVPAVSAASIVAKVHRDTYMERLGEQYAKWEFSSHVGYGTAKHIALLKQYGISDIHRKSYKPIKAYL